ncbi:MAG TPA: glycine cleavage T C-terminal barrel domain-containing protein, partial [Oceanipulchritudo sp.]|nr:glycine cleavage T C-terminal barrel domain-containing protein [Oceanipulchritudo sp.]
EAGKVCGRVLSGSQSPLTGRPIGSALVPAGDTTGPEQVFHVEIRKTRSRLHVARPPLHKVLPSD